MKKWCFNCGGDEFTYTDRGRTRCARCNGEGPTSEVLDARFTEDGFEFTVKVSRAKAWTNQERAWLRAYHGPHWQAQACGDLVHKLAGVGLDTFDGFHKRIQRLQLVDLCLERAMTVHTGVHWNGAFEALYAEHDMCPTAEALEAAWGDPAFADLAQDKGSAWSLGVSEAMREAINGNFEAAWERCRRLCTEVGIHKDHVVETTPGATQ